MLVEIRVLSGEKQGDRVQIDAESFFVGDDATCEIFFNPEKDPTARGRRARLWKTEEGWRIQNLGVSPVMVNYDTLSGISSVKSGDVIRMSDLGPDFSFTVRTDISKVESTASAAVASGETSERPSGPPGEAATSTTCVDTLPAFTDKGDPDEQASTKAPAVGHAPDTTAAPFQISPAMRVAATGLGVGLLGLLLFFLLFADPGLQIVEIPDQVVNETDLLRVDVKLDGAAELSDELVFKLDDGAPEGMHIDPSSGAITWTPKEEQGPGKYSVAVSAGRSGTQQALAQTSFIVNVREINHAPSLEQVNDRVLGAGETLSLSIKATDADPTEQALVFALEDGPAGASVDDVTGRMTWKTSARDENKELRITVRVTDQDGLSDKMTFRVVVRDAWSIVAEKVGKSVYLLCNELPGSQLVFPFGSACAIREDTLLTNGYVGMTLVGEQMKGRRVIALSEPDPDVRDGDEPDKHVFRRVEVTDIKVYKLFKDLANAPNKQVFFDFALLKTKDRLQHVVKMAHDQWGALEIRQPIGCVALLHNKMEVTRFVGLQPTFVKASVDRIYPFDDSDLGSVAGSPLLMQISAKMGEKATAGVGIEGGVVISKSGHILAVYASAADQKALGRANLHYAPIPVCVYEWLNGHGTDNWIDASAQ